MRIPLLSIDKPVFKPRPHFGMNPNLTDEQKLFIDCFDVQEQQMAWLVEKTIETRQIVTIVCVILILINGPQLYSLALGFFHH